MTKRMLIDATHAEETRVVVLDGNRLEDFDVETSTKKQLKGNIYLAKIVRVEPSLQAAFVEYGGGRHGFLAFGEIHPDYYQIPVADRQRLLAMQAQEAREEEEAEDAAATAEGAAEQRDRAGADADLAVVDDHPDGVATDDIRPDVVAEAYSAMDAADDIRADGADAPHATVEDDAVAEASAHDRFVHDHTADDPTGDDPKGNDVTGDEHAADASVAHVGGADEPHAALSHEAATPPAEPPAPEFDAHARDAEAADETATAQHGHDASEVTPASEAATPPVSHHGEPSEPPAEATVPPRPAQAAMIPQDMRFGEDIFERGPAETHVPGAGIVEDFSLDQPDIEPLFAEADIVADLEAETVDDETLPSNQPPPETIGGEHDNSDSVDEARERRSMRLLRNYRIQEVIRRRQIILVQVVKEERGTKGAALTTYISLAGRFCVLMPNSPRGGGISRKITSASDRRRLKEITAELDIPAGMGLIVRTAGAARPKPEIKRDAEYLMRLWDDIREHTMKSIAPALIYEEASLIKRSIRDVYSRDVDEILVDGEEGWRTAHDFMRMLMPSHAKKVQLWRPNGGTAPQPLFSKFAVEAQLDAMLSPTVQLKSGGYLVINQTEALVAIDVNSGRSTRERGIEETALRTNLEASDEVARQLRLRDLAGLIVIDYIDMESRKHNAAVERRLTEALKNDRARIQVGHISHFGLMEMSRQRLRPSLAETSFVMCQHCQGAGLVRSIESSAVHVLRAIEDEGAKAKASLIMVHCANAVAMYLLNNKRDRIGDIELRYAMRVHFAADESLPPPEIRIERLKPPVPEAERLMATPVLPAAPVFAVEDDVEDVEDEVMDDPAPPAPSRAQPPAPAPRAAAAETVAESEESQRRRRRRRRRGGRRENGESTPGTADAASNTEGDASASFDDNELPFDGPFIERETVEVAAVEGAVFAPAADEPSLDEMAAGMTVSEVTVHVGEGEPDAAVSVATDEQPAVDPADLDENGLPRARRRGRRGGRRRRRDGTFGEDAPVEPEAQAPVAPIVPAYVGPTPADPFGGHAFDIFDMMDEVESRPVATVSPRPAAAPSEVAPQEHAAPAAPVAHHDAEPAAAPVQGTFEMEQHDTAGSGDSGHLTSSPVAPEAPADADERHGTADHAATREATVEPEAMTLEPAAATAVTEPPPAPVIQPIVIGQDAVPAVAPKKGWWRR
jgi:ribonuclease E